MVLPGLATKIGLNEAIILQQIHYWTRDNRRVIDGYSWTYNSIPEWQKQFPFWSEITIRRVLKSLEEKGLIIRRALSEDRFDSTYWYALDMDAIFSLDDRSGPIKMIARSDQNERATSDQNDRSTSTETTAKTSTETTRGLTASALQADGLTLDLANELLAHRKRKKAPLTQRAWNAIKREAGKAGWMLSDAVEKLIEKDWKGFEAEWVQSRAQPGRPGATLNKQEALEARNRQIAMQLVAEMNGGAQ